MPEPEVVTALERNKTILRDLFANISDTEIERRIKDYWSIYEHLEHLVVCQKMLLQRIRIFIEAEHPVMVPYNPGDDGKGTNPPVSALLDEFCKLRDEQILLIKGAGKDVYQKEGSHEEYRRYTFDILLRHIMLHDMFHLYRIEELWILKEPYINPL
jgi:hypothetical protein